MSQKLQNMETIQNLSEETSSEVNGWKPVLRNNFILMTIAGLLIIVGFFFMSGDSSHTTHYNPDIFSTRRIVVGPMLSFIGYLLMAVAIILRPKQK